MIYLIVVGIAVLIFIGLQVVDQLKQIAGLAAEQTSMLRKVEMAIAYTHRNRPYWMEQKS